MPRIVGLGGGIGASRLWSALARAVPQQDLTLIVNTADDLWIYGVRVCPDLDTTVYALAGRQDTKRGWGLAGETWRTMDTLRGLGGDVWFNLGDRDLATHLYRTRRLRGGAGLSVVTSELAASMGVGARILPMTEDEVATCILTTELGWMPYEDYLVRHGAEPSVERVDWAGLADCCPGPGVLDAIASADVLVFAPSNPVASIAPVLGVPGIREGLRQRKAPVVVVTPLVCGTPIADPGEARRAASRTALMRSVGANPHPAGVAAMYADVCDLFVLDSADERYEPAIRALGVDVVVVPTLVHLGASDAGVLGPILTAAKSY
jgi:LPPG:FO 2-phospho-L-lactate transferase